jgi:hypothetical protein
VLLREGAKHSVFVNRARNKSSTIPRHREINDFLAKKICLTGRSTRTRSGIASRAVRGSIHLAALCH